MEQRVPAPRAPAAPAQGSTAPTPSDAADEYAAGDELEAWKKTLHDGSIEYRVPPEMTAHQASTVTVNVHGFADKGTTAMPDNTGTGVLAVSQYMKVELLAPLRPDEFQLTAKQEAVQFVPNGSYASWVWNVTPVDEAQHQQLLIRVSVVHRTPNSEESEFLVSNQYPVDVGVQKVSVTIRDNFYANPIAWFQYLSPTGKFWSAIGAAMSALGITGWISSKLNKRKATGS